MEAKADSIIAELSKEVSLGGLQLLDRTEYEKIPLVAAEELPNLRENEIDTRSGWVVLPTPPVANQGNYENSCMSFTVGYVGVSYYLYRCKGIPYGNYSANRSPEFLFNNTKLQGDYKANSTFPNALNFVRNYGVCSWAEMPYVSGCSNRGNTTPWSQARAGKIVSYRRITNTNASNLRDYVSRGYPLLTGIQLDDSFFQQTTSRNYNFTWHTKGGRPQFGHAAVIMGYNDTYRVFLVQNSWGTGVHDQGYFYISYDLIPSLSLETYVIDPAI